MKNYTARNFLEMLKYMLFSHAASAMIYIAFFSAAEESYVSSGKLEELHFLLLIISLVTFVISAVVMLKAHHGNSEKKMNYLNATYDGGNERKVSAVTALKESLTVALANLLFQLPMVVFFTVYGYRYSDSSVLETLYICDIGVYVFFKSAIIGALTIAFLWFAVYFLGVLVFIAPIWGIGRIRRKGEPTKPEENPQDAYYRHTFKNTYKVFYALRKFAISNLIAFGIFFIASFIFAAIESEMSPAAAKIFYGVFYAVVFYFVHGYRRDSSYFPHEKKFSLTKETAAVFREEIVYYLFIFLPLALVCEIFCFIYTGTSPAEAILRFVFPFYGVINVPVLRSLVNIVWACAVVLISITLKSAAKHRKVSRASKYRR
ncbi:MAG: hypothetical protein IJ021_06760 [Clostridia bacterium]|nr:hypothetical protein [Clostridia bacterium]